MYTLNNGTSTGTDTGSLRQRSSNVESGPSGLEPGMGKEAKGEVTKIQLKPSAEELRKSGRHHSRIADFMFFSLSSCCLCDSL